MRIEFEGSMEEWNMLFTAARAINPQQPVLTAGPEEQHEEIHDESEEGETFAALKYSIGDKVKLLSPAMLNWQLNEGQEYRDVYRASGGVVTINAIEDNQYMIDGGILIVDEHILGTEEAPVNTPHKMLYKVGDKVKLKLFPEAGVKAAMKKQYKVLRRQYHGKVEILEVDPFKETYRVSGNVDIPESAIAARMYNNAKIKLYPLVSQDIVEEAKEKFERVPASVMNKVTKEAACVAAGVGCKAEVVAVPEVLEGNDDLPPDTVAEKTFEEEAADIKADRATPEQMLKAVDVSKCFTIKSLLAALTKAGFSIAQVAEAVELEEDVVMSVVRGGEVYPYVLNAIRQHLKFSPAKRA